MDIHLDIVTLAVYDSSINDIIGRCVPWSVWEYKDREKTKTKTGTKAETETELLSH